MSDETVTTNPEETVQEFQQQDLINTEPAAEQPPAEASAPTGKKKGKTAEPVPESTDSDPPTVEGEGVCELDRGKDYAQVYGMPGVAFEQNHKYFNMEGFEVKPELEA